MDKDKIMYYLKTFGVFLFANLMLLLLHLIVIYNVLVKEAVYNAKNLIQFLTMPALYIVIIPFVLGYYIIYKLLKKKIKFDHITYTVLSSIVVLFYFGATLDNYYPDSKLISFFSNLNISNEIRKQNKLQNELKDELKEYYSIDTFEDVNVYLKSDKKNLILAYNDYYMKYDAISKKEYNKIFKLGQEIDNFMKEDYYSNNEIEYKIIKTTFFTYFEINSDTGFLLWTSNIIGNNEILKETYNKKIIIDKNYLYFGEIFNSSLINVDQITFDETIKIEKENSDIIVKGNINKNYKWSITKDNTFAFTIDQSNKLSLTSEYFQEPGTYKIHLEKKEGNSYVVASNEIIIEK